MKWHLGFNGLPLDRAVGSAGGYLTTGELDRDSEDELVVLVNDEIWILFDSGSWTKISTGDAVPQRIATGDLDGSGIDELMVSFLEDDGVWSYDVQQVAWDQLHTLSADHIAGGDLDGDGIDDVVGIWQGVGIPGVWTRTSISGDWTPA